jgi:hypothetical protein
MQEELARIGIAPVDVELGKEALPALSRYRLLKKSLCELVGL